MSTVTGFDRLFAPASIALIGASRDESKSGGAFLKSLITNGYRGEIFPVNPKEPEIMGLKSYASVLDIPSPVDLAILTMPGRAVPAVMAECARKGVRFAVVHGAGFSELGPEGKALEQQMLANARQGGTRIIGPNCMGIYSPQARVNTVMARTKLDHETGPVAFVGQSGWVTENVVEMGYDRGLRFSKVVSIGNQSDLTIEDFMDYFARDAGTKVMGFYIEGAKDPRRLYRLARETARRKPVVIWKAGRSEQGVKAAASHTGSLAGNNLVFTAAMGQVGVSVARNLDEMVDFLAGFTSPVLPPGNRLGLLLEAGGGAVAGVDTANDLGIQVPTFSPQVQQELLSLLSGAIPPFAAPRNPVDIVWAPAVNALQLFARCAQVMLKETDAVIIQSYIDHDEGFLREMSRVRTETGKPIFAIPGHPIEFKAGMSYLTKNGIPCFTMPERAVKTLAVLVRYSRYLRESR